MTNRADIIAKFETARTTLTNRQQAEGFEQFSNEIGTIAIDFGAAGDAFVRSDSKGSAGLLRDVTTADQTASAMLANEPSVRAARTAAGRAADGLRSAAGTQDLTESTALRVKPPRKKSTKSAKKATHKNKVTTD